MDDHPSRLVAKLKSDIEALSDLPALPSDMARAPGGTRHVTICNGPPKEEGAPAARWRSMSLMCADAMVSATKLRGAIAGRAQLYWRAEPFVGQNLYMRLCFEPL